MAGDREVASRVCVGSQPGFRRPREPLLSLRTQMLDFFRRSVSSVFTWLLLGGMALLFGLQFGLPSDSLTLGTQSIVKVHGESIGKQEFEYQGGMLIALGARPPEDVKTQMALGLNEEKLEAAIERELLAHEAQQLGLEATKRDAEVLALAGQFVAFGMTDEWPGPSDFNYEIFKNFVRRSAQVSEPSYHELQRRELLARTVRDLVAASVSVSEAELRATYDENANNLVLRIARYTPRIFADAVDPSAADIDTYVEDHADELRETFARQGMRFKGLPKQARGYLIALDTPADAAKPTPTAPAPGNALAPVRAKLSDARSRIVDGEDVRKLARELSTHASWTRGGDLGWIDEKSASEIDPALGTAMQSLADDGVSEIIEGASALYLLVLRGRHEGDIAEADALRELAEEAIRNERGAELAKTAAEADLAAVRGGASLGDVFRGGTALGTDDAPDSGTRGIRLKVALDETRELGKGDPITGLGPAPEVVNAAWAAEADGGLLDRVFTVGDEPVLAGVVSKSVATDEGFAAERANLYRRRAMEKGAMVAASWAQRLCVEAKGAGTIRADAEMIATLTNYTPPTKDDSPPPARRPYELCDKIADHSGLWALLGQRGG